MYLSIASKRYVQEHREKVLYAMRNCNSVQSAADNLQGPIQELVQAYFGLQRNLIHYQQPWRSRRSTCKEATLPSQTSFKSLKMTFFGAIQNSKRLFSEPPLKQKSGSSGPFSFFIIYCYIPKLVRALWLVNLVGRTLLHGPLKFKVFSLPNCCVIYHQFFSTYEANNSLKLSFTLNCVLKRANDLKMISNWLILLSTCFRNLKPFLVERNRSRTHQTYNNSYGSSLFPLWFMAHALCTWAIN